jgi:arylsulfatase A-like enzyme
MHVAIRNEWQVQRNSGRNYTPAQIRAIRRAFYAQCTHIDHQIRMVIGVLREEGMLDHTIICFTADHGDMLGNHQLWAKHWMYEDSACVPMIVVGTKGQSDHGPVGHHRVDERLVGWADVMPSLLHLAGIHPPDHCEGLSMFRESRQEYLYGAFGGTEGPGVSATRMIRTDRFKLVYYPTGNLVQLFDMHHDRLEQHDLAADPAHSATVEELTRRLIENLQGDERQWLRDGKLAGYPDPPRKEPAPNRAFSGQRGLHMPPPRVGSAAW